MCTDEEIQGLNREHRGLDRPTDVLSFPQYEPGERPVAGLPAALGDVVISVDTAARQAAERGASLSAETAWLFAHSVLHLLGYDDDTEEGLATMIAKAKAALAAM
jgi:probable rRNA maturation factor